MSVLAENPVADTTSLGTESQLEADSRALTQTRSKKLNLHFAISLTLFHLGAIAAFFFFRWSALLVFAVLWVIAQNIGIGMSYHRLLTHRGYVTPKWVEYAMAICATLAMQGGPIYWVSVHTGCITSSPTSRAIRTRPATANGGRTWAGSSTARCATATAC